MACVFCGFEGKLSNEHVFPAWLRPYLSHPDGEGTHSRTELRDGKEILHRERRGNPASWTVKSVCRDCNHGWMSTLEESAKPRLLPMIQGHGRTLNNSAQALVASWGVKTALVAGSKFPPQIPLAFYGDFREAGAPVEQTRVWLGHAPHLEAHTMDWRPMRTHRDDENPPYEPNGFQAVLSVGHLVVFVVAWRGRKPPLHKVFDVFEFALVKIWPTHPPAAAWPPSATITLGGLDELANALGSVPSTGAPR